MDYMTQRAINATLHNDENSTDEELILYFMEELGLSRRQAEMAVGQRDKCLIDMFYEVELDEEESQQEDY